MDNPSTSHPASSLFLREVLQAPSPSRTDTPSLFLDNICGDHTSAWALGRHLHLPGKRDSLMIVRTRAHHLQTMAGGKVRRSCHTHRLLSTASQECADPPHEPEHGVHVLHQRLVPPEDLGSRVLGIGEPVSVLGHQGLHPTSVEYSLKEPAGTRVVTHDSHCHTAGSGCGQHGGRGSHSGTAHCSQGAARSSCAVGEEPSHYSLTMELPQLPHL